MADAIKPRPINPTPKQRFLEMGPWISAHRKMVDSPEFQRAIDFSLQHYVRFLTETAPTDLTQPNHVVASGMCFQRIQGARELIDVLTKLSEMPPPKIAPQTSDNLDN